MGIIFGRTQSAVQTPFQPLRNPGYGGGASPLVSTETQSAIEESLARAIANDRYSLLFSYNGNANVGRYLEVFPGIDSSVAPILFPIATNVLFLVSATTAASETCTFGWYNIAPVTPVLLYTTTFTAQKRLIETGAPTLFSIPAGALLAMKVDSGAINRPHVYFSASTGG